MWTRKELKQNAKEALNRNYWKTVLVSLILLLLGGSLGPASATSSSTSNKTITEYGTAIQEYPNVDSMSETTISSTASELKQADAVVFATTVIVIIIIILVIIAAAVLIAVFVSNPIIVGSQRFMLKSIDGKGNIGEIGYAFDHSYINCVKAMFFRELYTFLWMLLFIIPGIYKRYQYYVVEYILAEHPDIPYKEVLNLSKEMMEGHKWNAFVLDLSFILWHILSLLTCGVLEIFFVGPYVNLTRASLYRSISRNYESRNDGLPSVTPEF